MYRSAIYSLLGQGCSVEEGFQKECKREADGIQLLLSHAYCVDRAVGKPGGDFHVMGRMGIDKIRNCDGGSEIYACFLPTVTLNSAIEVI
jgi:hypothetical protein